MKTIKLFNDYGTYPIWIFNENGDLIDNDLPAELIDLEEAEIWYALNHKEDDIETMESDYQDLTFNSLINYYSTKGITLNLSTYKKNLGLLNNEGKYNLLAQLLSDNSHINIRVSIFAGTSKADPLFSVKEFGLMNLLLSLDKVLDYGDTFNIPQADERNRIVERKEKKLGHVLPEFLSRIKHTQDRIFSVFFATWQS